MLNSCLRIHFFEHLQCTLSHVVAGRFPFPYPLLSRAPNKCLLNSTPATMLPTAAISGTSATSSFASSPYFSVKIQCPKAVSDSLSEALLCFGATSTSMDVQDTHENKDKVCITSIFSDSGAVDECISQAAKSIGLDEIHCYELTEGDQSEWVKLSQESFYPIEITKGLWTVPEWTTPPDPQATNIILNPGFAFGTGDHPTTKLCLMLLHGIIKGGELVLDYGMGSGVLAIAAVKFGAALSVGLDIDPEAITSARYNASLNNIEGEKLQFHLVNSKKKTSTADEAGNNLVEGQTGELRKYDVVIANILLNPLLDLADHIVSYAKPRAVIGVSGILSEQIPLIEERYSQFLEGVSVVEMDDWALISGTKKKEM